MRFLHIADLHLGQIMYQYYERNDEHRHFFGQLHQWCEQYRPDALLVSGDIFDIQQPGAAVRDFFNSAFVDLHRHFPNIQLVITAGNHDSAARIEADREVWGMADVKLVGHAPSPDATNQPDGWQDRFIVEMPTGFIAALPFMSSVRSAVVQSILDRIAQRNTEGLPVVMMAHLAVTGSDITGHGTIGNLRTVAIDEIGSGYDYLALGHIHRPQTIGHSIADENNEHSSYPAGIARYSGSVLYVNCDEQYTHTASLVDIDRRGGTVNLTRLRIDQLMDFYTLPETGKEPAMSADEIIALVDDFCSSKKGYIRLRIDSSAALPSDFAQSIYRKTEATEGRVRWNPNTITENSTPAADNDTKPAFKVAELQQINPLDFIRKTIHLYPELDLEQLEEDFKTIEEELTKGDDKQ